MNKSKCPTVQSPYTVNPRNPCNIYIQTAQKKTREKKNGGKSHPFKTIVPSNDPTKPCPPSTQQCAPSLPPSPQRIDRSPWTRRKIRHAILISRFSSKIHNDKVEGIWNCNRASDISGRSSDRRWGVLTLLDRHATRSSGGVPLWNCSLLFLHCLSSIRGTTADVARHANKQWIHEYENFHENSPAVYPRRRVFSMSRLY